MEVDSCWLGRHCVTEEHHHINIGYQVHSNLGEETFENQVSLRIVVPRISFCSSDWPLHPVLLQAHCAIVLHLPFALRNKSILGPTKDIHFSEKKFENSLVLLFLELKSWGAPNIRDCLMTERSKNSDVLCFALLIVFSPCWKIPSALADRICCDYWKRDLDRMFRLTHLHFVIGKKAGTCHSSDGLPLAKHSEGEFHGSSALLSDKVISSWFIAAKWCCPRIPGQWRRKMTSLLLVQ